MISVVLAAYNAQDFIAEAIESILQQTFTDFELIIINDGSTDYTEKIIRSYSDKRIIYAKNNHNIGQTKSLKRGINEFARGVLIARVDADDTAEREMFFEMAKYLENNHECSVLGTSKNFIDTKGVFIREFHPPTTNNEIQQALMSWNCLPHGGTIYRSSSLLEVDNYDEKIGYAQDYDLALRITEPSDAANIPIPLYNYRWHNKMVSSTKKAEQEYWAQIIIEKAIRRRLNFGNALISGKSDRKLPKTLQFRTKKWWAERLTCWSIGVRGQRRFFTSLRFLIFALLIDPGYQPAWEFARSAFIRKTNRFINRSSI